MQRALLEIPALRDLRVIPDLWAEAILRCYIMTVEVRMELLCIIIKPPVMSVLAFQILSEHYMYLMF